MVGLSPGREITQRTVLCVFGTRPEAIKMAPVYRALREHAGLQTVVCVTDQHRDMLDPVLDFFGIQPDWRLGVFHDGQSPSEIASRILHRLPSVFAAARPAAVLVQGDTTTTFAAALAAFYNRIPVGHVEAGLRTYQPAAPFPEELNRQMTTLVSEWHFAPTTAARDNLLRAGVAPHQIAVTGNPVIDSLEWTMGHIERRCERLASLFDGEKKIVLVTAHRRESFGGPLSEICMAVRDLIERNPDVEVIYPLHLNPMAQQPVKRLLKGRARIHLLPPVEYWEMVDLLRRCYLVLTDSGGIQEEAPSLGKPVLVLRNTTERPEGIEAGTSRLVGTSRERIVHETERVLRDATVYAAMARIHHPYGDGHAGERIAKLLVAALESRSGDG